MQARAAEILGGSCRGVREVGRGEGVWCGGGGGVHGAAVAAGSWRGGGLKIEVKKSFRFSEKRRFEKDRG